MIIFGKFNKRTIKYIIMGKYEWKFSTIGGMTRVNIESGEDIKHLGELDQKLWTVLSCPVSGLEFDPKTLQMLDSDGDGRIRVNEVVAAADWLTSVINDPDLLLKKDDVLPLSAFNTENAEGAKLLASAKQILANLGLEKDSISLADTEDSVAIFAKTALNGDGIITEQSTEDEALKKTIAECIASMGSKTDRCGLPGVDAELIDGFYGALAAYAAWKQAAEDGKAEIFPYGDDTAAACDAVNSIKAKVADYFMRCKLAVFNQASSQALDVSASRIEAISDKDLSACDSEIAQYPLAHLTSNNTLPIDGRINPVWQATFAKLNAIVFNKEFEGAKEISEEQWQAVVAKLAAYEAWTAAKAGAQVEALGLDEVKALIAADRKADLLKLVEDDKALEAESTSIDAVNKLMHYYRDFYKLLCNYVSFSDFYNPNEKAIFQAGRLYIDERCCELCIKVEDMGPHNATAGLSGMFILYCNCVSKKTGAAMTIAAILTDGDIADLRDGKHGVFYDNNGNDWDATIVKIVDNPISIRQAFWSPYRKLGKFIEDKISKNADAKDAKVVGDLTAKADNPNGGKQPFDIAKFAGIGAMVTVAIAAISGAVAGLIGVLSQLEWWKLLIVIAVILLVISGPAMIKAWLKLRKRNLGPVLNANNWAINAAVKVNVPFGATLTEVSKTPIVVKGNDPYAIKTPFWKKLLRWVIALAAFFAILYYSNFFGWVGCDCLKHEKKPKAQTEQIVSAPAEDPVAE